MRSVSGGAANHPSDEDPSPRPRFGQDFLECSTWNTKQQMSFFLNREFPNWEFDSVIDADRVGARLS
jgi:hypothetical protein